MGWCFSLPLYFPRARGARLPPLSRSSWPPLATGPTALRPVATTNRPTARRGWWCRTARSAAARSAEDRGCSACRRRRTGDLRWRRRECAHRSGSTAPRHTQSGAAGSESLDLKQKTRRELGLGVSSRFSTAIHMWSWIGIEAVEQCLKRVKGYIHSYFTKFLTYLLSDTGPMSSMPVISINVT